MGQPEDLMGAVTFLSSDASSYVTGQHLLLHPYPSIFTPVILGALCLEYCANHFRVGADLRVDGGYTVT
jgi:NAD(P)-dependent dehydrogenase (short-subunit alcohol dehydrogenase family)